MTEREHVVVLGFDGEGLAVATREAWALTPADAAELYRAARRAGLGAGVLSTCFRVEVVVAGRREPEALADWARGQLAALRPGAPVGVFTTRTGDEALRHLLRVASGLESAVLGEAQILGQVRRARAHAQAAGALSPALRLALAAAVRAGQRVRQRTGLGRGAASTASAAVRLADQAGGLAGRHAFVIGAGQIGRLLMDRLRGAGLARLTLVSAHAPEHVGFRVLRPEHLAEHLGQADVVFASTDRLALPLAVAQAAWADGRARTVVDLGVPRNVPDEVGRVPGVALHDVDALGQVVDAGLRARREAVPEAMDLVEAELRDVLAELDGLGREALIADLRRRAERVRGETVAHVCGRCGDRTCEPQPGQVPRCSDPDTLTRTLTTRLFHDLTASLRQRADGLAEDDLRRLFALDDD